MFNTVKNLLSRRQLVGSGIGILGVGMTGMMTHNSPAIAQPASKPSQEPPMPDEKKLGWAVVGLGKFARQQIIPSLAECKQSKLVALVSGDRNKAESYARQYSKAIGN
jgi:hypothetical protein